MPYESYRKKFFNVTPTIGDRLEAYATRNIEMEQTTTMEFFESHRSKHFCHYGPFPCYICPLWNGYRTVSEDLLEISKLLKKHHIFIEYDGKKWLYKHHK